MDFDELVQIVIMYSAFVKYLRKKWECNGAEYKLFRDFKVSYNSVRKRFCVTFCLGLVYA